MQVSHREPGLWFEITQPGDEQGHGIGIHQDHVRAQHRITDKLSAQLFNRPAAITGIQGMPQGQALAHLDRHKAQDVFTQCRGRQTLLQCRAQGRGVGKFSSPATGENMNTLNALLLAWSTIKKPARSAAGPPCAAIISRWTSLGCSSMTSCKQARSPGVNCSLASPAPDRSKNALATLRPNRRWAWHRPWSAPDPCREVGAKLGAQTADTGATYAPPAKWGVCTRHLRAKARYHAA